MIKLLKIGAILEGVSVIALFMVAIPMKYILGNPILIKSTGMIHGILFVIYSLLVLLASRNSNWKVSKIGLLLLLGFIPFGTFYAERKLI